MENRLACHGSPSGEQSGRGSVIRGSTRGPESRSGSVRGEKDLGYECAAMCVGAEYVYVQVRVCMCVDAGVCVGVVYVCVGVGVCGCRYRCACSGMCTM